MKGVHARLLKKKKSKSCIVALNINAYLEKEIIFSLLFKKNAKILKLIQLDIHINLFKRPKILKYLFELILSEINSKEDSTDGIQVDMIWKSNFEDLNQRLRLFDWRDIWYSLNFCPNLSIFKPAFNDFHAFRWPQ